MNVSCPQCTTVFRVDPAKVPERGVRARCSVCGGLIAVRRPSVGVPAVPPLPAPPAAIAPEASVPPPLPAPEPAPAAPPVMPYSAVPDPAVPAALTTVLEEEAAAPPSPDPAEPVMPFSVLPDTPVITPPPPPPPPTPPASSAPTPPGAGHFTNPFLQQDPGTRARRLARALVSDLVVYHPDKRQRGLADGNLEELFAEEIRKSWEEYREQIGEQVARETNYFTEALNEILAEGRPIFS